VGNDSNIRPTFLFNFGIEPLQAKDMVDMSVGIDPRVDATRRPGPNVFKELFRMKDTAGIHKSQPIPRLQHQGIRKRRHKAEPGFDFLKVNETSGWVDIDSAQVSLPGPLGQLCNFGHRPLLFFGIPESRRLAVGNSDEEQRHFRDILLE
jgi:hypothetical protein